jgi:hypothetical protein
MTKLEKELQVAILDNGADYAKAAAEVAKRYIENAYTDAYQKANQYRFRAAAINKAHENKIAWLLKNGVAGEVNS